MRQSDITFKTIPNENKKRSESDVLGLELVPIELVEGMRG